MDDSGEELFDAEDIDGMEAVMLDNLSAEELKAFRSKVNRTLKAIREQEQLWKQRVNLLMDMREEAENLIEEKS
jgi:hypothetical protein